MRFSRRSTLVALIVLAAVTTMVAGCAVDPMEELSQKQDSPRLIDRQQAVLALANLKDTRALRALVDVLESDEEVCDLAGAALVKRGRESRQKKKPDPVVDAVSTVMANVHLADCFRARAAWVLGEIGKREAIPALKIASADLKEDVANAAKAALDKLGYSSEARAYEIPWGTLAGTVEVLPEPQPVVVPPDEESS